MTDSTPDPTQATTAVPPKTFNHATWRGPLEIGSKFIVGFVGVAYVVGLLILNLHVRKYGIYYLNFLQIEYVMVGILWICLQGWVYCLFLAIMEQCKLIFKVIKTKQALLEMIFLLSVLGGSYISLWVVLTVLTKVGEDVSLYSIDWKILWALLAGSVGLFNLSRKLKDLRIQLRLGQTLTKGKAYMLFKVFDTFFFVLLIIIGLAGYSYNAFPKISGTFGGGKPQKTEFLIKTNCVDTVSAIGFQVLPDSRKTAPMEVVFEASDFFLIKTPDGFADNEVKAIRVNKDLIDATFYLGSK
jgi:hypothetical protein